MDRMVLSKVLFMTCLFFIPKTSFCDELTELKTRMLKMQEETKTLQEELTKQKEVTGTLLEKIKATEMADTALSTLGHDHDMRLQDSPDIPKLQLNGFADVGFTARISDSRDSNNFRMGTIDLFITSEIMPKISYVVETNFFFVSATNDQEFDLQRAEIRYWFSDLFNIKLGRLHTPLGYWNQAFHHGTWVQTTTARPDVYLFEGQGGVLPVHSIGGEFLGRLDFHVFGLEYNFNVVNGRGRVRNEIQHAADQNDAKAVNILLSLVPHFTEGLKLGTNLYLDVIPENPGVAARAKEINERIIGGYLIYLYDRIEFFAEGFNIYHDDKTSGKDFNTLGLYVQGGYRIDTLKPYYRFDLLEFEQGDPFFGASSAGLNRHTLGLRWDVYTWNALKIEYSMADRKGQEDEHSLTLNTSFAF